MKKKTRNLLIIGGGFLLVLLIGCIIFVLFTMPIFPQSVRLKSAIYLRTPHTYTMDSAGYDPSQLPLEPSWFHMDIDRENNRVSFRSTSGEEVTALLGKPTWVSGCESQYRVEAFPFQSRFSLGSVTFKQPFLVMVCDMWSRSEKFRPGRIIITEGPIAEDHPFMFGVRCEPGSTNCISFAEKIGELVLDVKDEQTGIILSDANIQLSSGMGIEDYTGEARIPLYAGIQMEFKISQPGYLEKVGKIDIISGNKLGIDVFSNPEKTTGEGAIVDLPPSGQPVGYSFLLTKE